MKRPKEIKIADVFLALGSEIVSNHMTNKISGGRMKRMVFYVPADDEFVKNLRKEIQELIKRKLDESK